MSEKIIVSNKKQLFPDFNEIIRYKDLFFTLAWRDFRVRYAQTTIGLLWALLQPLITLLILTLVFGTFIAVKTPVPHLLFTLAGMSIWTYFSYFNGRKEFGVKLWYLLTFEMWREKWAI